jgi:hypothetical protein
VFSVSNNPSDTVDYAKHVERAASDLGSRRAREHALDQVLEPVFP